MLGFGDAIVVIMCVFALAYGIFIMIKRKLPLYFKLSVATVACLMLGYIFDICDYLVHDYSSGGYVIGYLGSFGSFLFLLTASVGYMDGIMDDGSPQVKKCRYLACIAPLLAVMLWVPNMFSDASTGAKIVYSVLWIPAIFSLYYNTKHAILPDMGFGFIKAIRPFNIAAISFTLLQLIHLTLWNFCGWITLLISGALFGASCIAMIIAADWGVKKWIL
jgi:hypothetical protein